jgi:hypothetical protein
MTQINTRGEGGGSKMVRKFNTYFLNGPLSQFQYYLNYIICSTALTWSVPVIELQLVMGIDFKPEIQQCEQCHFKVHILLFKKGFYY